MYQGRKVSLFRPGTVTTRCQKAHLAVGAHDIVCYIGLDFRVFVPVT